MESKDFNASTFLDNLDNTKLFKLMSIEKSIVEGKLVEFTESDISDYNTKMLHELKDLVEYLNTYTDPNVDVESDIVIEKTPDSKIPTITVNKLIGREWIHEYIDGNGERHYVFEESDRYLTYVDNRFNEFSSIYIFLVRMEESEHYIDYTIRESYCDKVSKKVDSLLKWITDTVIFSIVNTTCKQWHERIRHTLKNNKIDTIGKVLGIGQDKIMEIEDCINTRAKFNKLNIDCKSASFVCLGEYILQINTGEISNYLDSPFIHKLTGTKLDYFYTINHSLKELVKVVDKVVSNNIKPVKLSDDLVDKYNGSIKTMLSHEPNGTVLWVTTSDSSGLTKKTTRISKSNIVNIICCKTGIDNFGKIRVVPRVVIDYAIGERIIEIELVINHTVINDFIR